MQFQKYIAELIGTFALTLIVSLSLLVKLPLPTPVLAGLTLGLFVYTIGHLSGAHLNPAVTIGLATVKKISVKDAVMYVITQILGALLALALVRWLTDSATVLVADNTFKVGVAEALGTFFLAFGVSSVAYNKAPDAASGIVVGGSLMLGIHVAAGFSNGVVNPAVAIGIGSVSWMYLLAPIAGSIVACWIFRLLEIKK